MANISMEVVLGMLFLMFKNTRVKFAEKELTWRTYTIEDALPTTCWVKLLNQKKFAKEALDENIEAFIMYVSFLELKMTIYLTRQDQMALLLAEKVTVPAEYSDFADVFLEKLANILPEQIEINEHTIKLENGKQLPYEHIYSLGPVELKTLKTYIKTNLVNGFIRALKSPVGAPILFVRKPNSSFYLYINY